MLKAIKHFLSPELNEIERLKAKIEHQKVITKFLLKNSQKLYRQNNSLRCINKHLSENILKRIKENN